MNTNPALHLSCVVHILVLTIGATTLANRPLLAQSWAEPGTATELHRSVTLMSKVGFCGSASFSPDGKVIAFVSNMTGIPQVWTVPAEGGWPTLLTALEDPVGQVVWSPDGAWLAISVAPGGGMNTQVYLLKPDGSGLTRVTDGGKENNRLGDWSPDGKRLAISSNRDKPESIDAYIFDLTTRQLRLVARNNGVGSLMDMSADGKLATLTRMRSRGNNDMYLVDLENGHEALLTAHEGPGQFFGGEFSPDGKTVYLGSNKDRDLVAFARIQIGADGKPGPIEVLVERKDAELEDFALSDDGRTVALMWNVAGRSEMALVDLATHRITAQPKLPVEIAGGLNFAKHGESISLTMSGPASPSDIWLFSLSSGKFNRLTHSPHAGVDLASLVRPELVRFKAHDGLELSGWLYRPQDAKSAGPIVLSYHGGPEGQERPSFRSDYQALLARGIAVFAPNVRGSAGFGKRFVNLDNGPLRVNAVKDIRSCVEYVVNKGVGDPKRIGIMGGSYGGFMTMAGLTEYPEMFAAGANFCGVVNFETFFAHTEPWMAAVSTVEYGDPKTQASLLRELSPIHKIDRVQSPVLVLHGANDTNVPVVEADQVVENLKKRGVPVGYVLCPDEGHGFRKTSNRIRGNVATVEWFEKYLARKP